MKKSLNKKQKKNKKEELCEAYSEGIDKFKDYFRNKKKMLKAKNGKIQKKGGDEK
jgi:hypothetical protein